MLIVVTPKRAWSTSHVINDRHFKRRQVRKNREGLASLKKFDSSSAMLALAALSPAGSDLPPTSVLLLRGHIQSSFFGPKRTPPLAMVARFFSQSRDDRRLGRFGNSFTDL